MDPNMHAPHPHQPQGGMTPQDQGMYNQKLHNLRTHCGTLKAKAMQCRAEGNNDAANKLETMLGVLEGKRMVSLEYLTHLENWINKKADFLLATTSSQPHSSQQHGHMGMPPPNGNPMTDAISASMMLGQDVGHGGPPMNMYGQPYGHPMQMQGGWGHQMAPPPQHMGGHTAGLHMPPAQMAGGGPMHAHAPYRAPDAQEMARPYPNPMMRPHPGQQRPGQPQHMMAAQMGMGMGVDDLYGMGMDDFLPTNPIEPPTSAAGGSGAAGSGGIKARLSDPGMRECAAASDRFELDHTTEQKDGQHVVIRCRLKTHSVPPLRLVVPTTYPKGSSIIVERPALDMDSFMYDDLQNVVHERLQRPGLMTITDYLDAWESTVRQFYLMQPQPTQHQMPPAGGGGSSSAQEFDDLFQSYEL
mgnify:CR=1 FL=1